MVGAVGRDDDGTRYVRALRERGVNTGGVTQLEGSPTGAAVMFVDDCGENLIVVDAGVNAALSSTWVRAQVLDRLTPLTVVQLEVPLAALEALVATMRKDELLVFNPAPMACESNELEHILQCGNVIVPNRTELGSLARRREPQTMDEVDECVVAPASSARSW